MLSNECFLPTAPVSRPSAPQMFTLVSTGLTSLTAFWEPLDPSNDIIYSYLLYCRAVEGSFYSGEPHPETDNIFNPIESTNVTSIAITGLNAFSDYECYVTASTGEVELEGVPSNTVRIRTGGFEDGEFHVCIVHAIMHALASLYVLSLTSNTIIHLSLPTFYHLHMQNINFHIPHAKPLVRPTCSQLRWWRPLLDSAALCCTCTETLNYACMDR